MFSTGQLVFTIVFIILFTILIVRAYRKDKTLHKRNYRGVGWIAMTFVAFVILLFVIKYLLRN